MKVSNLACVVSLLALAIIPARSNTITWTNAASGNWSAAANWSPNQVPSTNDTAIITKAVTVTLDISPTVGGITLGANGGCGGGTTLIMNNQTLTMNGPLVVGSCGSFTVNSGTLSGNAGSTLSGVIGWTGGFLGGSLTLAANGTLNIAGGSGNNDLPNCTLTNFGTVSWSSGHIRVNSGTVINNQGLWDNQADLTLDNNGYSGTGTFINAGTFRKSAGNSATYTTIGVGGSGLLFNQTGGILDVQQGLVAFFGGGNFTGGYVTTNTTGAVDFSAGSFTINGTVTSANVWQAEGNLVGVNVIQGGMNWIEGVWNGATVTIASNTLVTITGAGGTFQDGLAVPISGGGFNDLSGCNFTNFGTVAWTSGHIRVGQNTVIDNQGVWDCQSDLVLDNNGYSGSATIINSGTFRKSVGAGGSAYSQIGDSGGSVLSFNQTGGVLDVQQGLLALFGGGNFTGGYVTTNNTGSVDFAGGSFNINGTVTSANVWQAEGNLVGVNVIQGGFNWIEGTWTGATVTIASNAFVTITGAGGTFQDGAVVSNSGGGFNQVPNCNITNYGTVAWTSGHIVVGTTIINNQGLWDCQGDFTLDNNGSLGGGTFINAGTFRKSVGSTANSTTFGVSIIFNQTGGVLDVQHGFFTLIGSGNFTGGYVTTNSTGTTVLASGSFTVNGTITSTNVCQADANLVGVNVLAGGFTWAGAGTWDSATVTIASNAFVIISGAGANLAGGVFTVGNGFSDMPGCNLANYGAIAWTSGHIRVGSGTVINNLGLWDCQGDLALDNGNDFAGSATFNNSGTFRKSATSGGSSQVTLSFTNNGTLDARNGTLAVNNSFTNPAGSLAVENGSEIQLPQPVVIAPTATVTGSGTIQASSITSSGLVSPGAANAVLTIAGNYTQLLPGKMQFDLAGTSPGVNQSQVNVTGSAALNGVVSLRFDSGYSPAVNSSNVVLTAASVKGRFPFLDRFLLLGQNKRMTASYNPTDVVLTAVSAPDPAGPSLSTAAVQNHTFAVFFPSEFSNYGLFDKTNLTDPAWTLVPAGTNLYSENPLTASNKFFLLIKLQ